MKKWFLLFLMIISQNTIQADGIVDTLHKATSQLTQTNKELFGGVVGEKKKLLEKLMQEKADLSAEHSKAESRLQMSFTEVRTAIEGVEKEIVSQSQDAFLSQKLSLLQDLYQMLKDRQRAREELIALLSSFIQLLEDFLSSPNFEEYRQEHRLIDNLYASFNDVLHLHDAILEQEKRVDMLSDQEKSAQAEYETRKKSVASDRLNYEKIKARLNEGTRRSAHNFSSEQSQELLILQEKLRATKQVLDELRMRETKQRAEYLAMRLFMEKTRLSILKNHLVRIKPSVTISSLDVEKSREHLNKERVRYYQKKELLDQKREWLINEIREKKKIRDDLMMQYGMEGGRDLDSWIRKPNMTVEGYVGLSIVGAANTHLTLLKQEQDLAQAQLGLEIEKFGYDHTKFRVKESYHKALTHKLKTEEAVAHEIKTYEAPRSEAHADILAYKEKLAAIPDLLNSQKKIREAIQKIREDVAHQKMQLFKGHHSEYVWVLELLAQAESDVVDQIEALGKLSGVYSGLISSAESTLRLIDFIVAELQSTTIWHRPEYAITWWGVKNFTFDIATFFNDLRAYITHFNPAWILNKIKNLAHHPVYLLMLILKIFLIIGGCVLFKKIAPFIISGLSWIRSEYRGFIRYVAACIEAVVKFLKIHTFLVGLWVVLYTVLAGERSLDPYVYIFFYMFSIPYLLYCANIFIAFLSHFNMKHEYILVSQDFQRRFFVVLSFFLSATIIISFFKESFVLGNYYTSELPTILLVVNFIIFQTALILLLTKEHILNLIPTRTEFGHLIRSYVDRYYYGIQVCVIAIIIMLNPYVGFGRLVLYVMLALLYTTLLLIGLMWIYGVFKRAVSRLFFVVTEDTVRERFIGAKSWFGILIIISFVIMSFLGIFVIARIWGWALSFSDVMRLLREPLIGKGTTNPVTTVSLIRLALFVLAGFIVSYILNRFVLDKIFNLLLIDSGVQHTVTSITQYVVVILALFVGFQSVGLGEFVKFFLGALVLSIGWVLREPISDFASYFIILVQRPVKIGDYVQLQDSSGDQMVNGVVRRITARAVVLRRKNSTTLIIPNTKIITTTLENWNYSRNFVAFNDILITVDFREDPIKVRDLFFTVLDAHSTILKNPKPIVRLEEFTEYGYQFLIRGYISSAYTLEMWAIASDVRFGLIKALRTHNMRISIPIRTVVAQNGNVLQNDSDQTKKEG